jgi:hypothetical protein
LTESSNKVWKVLNIHLCVNLEAPGFVSGYDFYLRVVKDRFKQTSEFSDPSQQLNDKNRTNELTIK